MENVISIALRVFVEDFSKETSSHRYEKRYRKSYDEELMLTIIKDERYKNVIYMSELHH